MVRALIFSVLVPLGFLVTVACNQIATVKEPTPKTLIVPETPAVSKTTSQTREEQAEKPILFTNVNVFDGTSDKLAAGQNVLIEGNLIKEISPNLQVGDGVKVIDGGGRTLIPGLIEAHGHLQGSVNPTVMVTTLTPIESGVRMAVRAENYLMKGFTTVRDVGGNVFAVKAVIDEGTALGPRLYPSGAGISQTGGHADLRLPSDGSGYFDGPTARGNLSKLGFAILADGVPEVQKAVREQLYRGASQIKVMAGGGVTSLADPLDAVQYTLEEMKAAVEEARRYGTYVLVHAHTDNAINQALDAGVICIEHGMLIEERTMKRIADKGVFLSPQAFITLQPPEANPALQDPINIAKLRRVNSGSENELKWAKKYGVKLLWGTDMFGDEANFNLMLNEWEYRGRYFTPLEQLQQATGNGGEILAQSGLKNPYPEGPLGVIKPGAYADMLLVEGDPTQDISIMINPKENFKIIMKDGKIYKNTLEGA